MAGFKTLRNERNTNERKKICEKSASEKTKAYEFSSKTVASSA